MFRFSSRRKRSKIFSSVSVFPNFFHLSALKRSKTMKATEARDCVFVKVQQDHKTILHLGKMLQFGLEPMACDAFYVTDFKSFHFHPSTLETECFQKSPLLKAFSKVSVFIGVFWRLMDGRRKRIKKRARFQTKTHWCAFSGNLRLGYVFVKDPQQRFYGTSILCW